jgi:hypothetical protein
MMMSYSSGSDTWVESSGIRVGSAHLGEEDAWRASGPRGQHPRRRMTARKDDFDVGFNSGFVSSSFTQWYGQNTILTTFIFEQKIKHHFKPYALIPIVGDSGFPMRGPVVY